MKAENYSSLSSTLRKEFAQSLHCAVNFASVKRASGWLTALPLQKHGFACFPGCFGFTLWLVTSHFILYILYSETALCACGSSFSVDHVLSCPKGGLPSLRHNDVRDLTASLLTEVCSQVIVEPELQPVSNPDEFSLATSNTQEGACLDVAMNGFWGSQSERCFVDVNADTGPYPGFLVGWGVLFQKKWTFLNEVCYKYGMQSMPVSKEVWGHAPPPTPCRKFFKIRCLKIECSLVTILSNNC